MSNIAPKTTALRVVPKTASEPPKAEPAKRQRRKRSQPLYLQFEEIERLFIVIESPLDRAIFRLAYHAGLRASEVGRLELRDCNARTERIFIHRLKGSNSGEHHLCREESRALRAWLKIRGSIPGAIFLSNRRSPIRRSMLDVLMKRYGSFAGIPAKLCHFHILKHTCATHLMSKGFHVDQVQDWIGHANIQNTMIYAHTTNARRDEMAQQLRDT
jgi:integrase